MKEKEETLASAQNEVIETADGKTLTSSKEESIKQEAAKIAMDKRLKRVIPVVIFGDTGCDNKPLYVAYLREPSLPEFSKFMAATKKDEVLAMKALATDCFVEGDRELLSDDSLFLFGLMPRVQEVIGTRQSQLVNFSMPGK